MDKKNEIIILHGAYNKTPGLEYYIQPCIDPNTGEYPDCVRDTVDDKSYNMILSESDKEARSKGAVFIPVNKPIKVHHGSTFDLSVPRQRAEWEAIKNSKFIAESRNATDFNGNYLIDGEKVRVMENGVATGKSGIADLYVYRPGVVAESKNQLRELIFKATGLVLNDPAGLSGWITKCKLLEKDMSRAPSGDVKDYLLTQAEKHPQKIIELYTGTTTQIRLLLIDALDKHIVVKRNGMLYYSDDIVLGSSMDSAVTYLAQPEHSQIKEMIEQETFPELFKKAEKKSEKKTEKNVEG